MTNQLVVPEYAKCPNCDIEAKDSKSVYDVFGIRMLKDTLEAQSHCKNCRKLVLKGKFKDQFNQFKESCKKKLHERTQKAIESFNPEFEKLREELRIIKEEKWAKANEKLKAQKDKIQEEINNQIEAKRNELLSQMAREK